MESVTELRPPASGLVLRDKQKEKQKCPKGGQARVRVGVQAEVIHGCLFVIGRARCHRQIAEIKREV